MAEQWTLNELADKAQEQGRPVTTGYLRRLCRAGASNGGIDATKLGRDWVGSDG